MQVFTLPQINSLLSSVWAIVADNAVGFLIVFGTIVGISFATAMIGEALKIGGNHGEWRGPSGKRYKY